MAFGQEAAQIPAQPVKKAVAKKAVAAKPKRPVTRDDSAEEDEQATLDADQL